MKIGVTKQQVSILVPERINGSEKGVNTCEFVLPDEFEGLTVTAVFNGVPVPLEGDSTCVIPPLEKGDCTLGVYAYREDDGEVELMYSPSPAAFFVERGSFDRSNGSEIGVDISLYEQYCLLIREHADSVADELSQAEQLRTSAETQRVSAENARQTAETERLSAESARLSAESARAEAELARAAAESARASSETNRQAALINALGIHSIVIVNTDNGESYIPQLKIENGRPRLYLDPAAAEEE